MNIKKRKGIVVTVLIGIISAVLLLVIYLSAMKAIDEIVPYRNNQSISEKEMFERKDHFYVYFYKRKCKFCNNIEDDMQTFCENNMVFVNDTEKMEGINDYDWIEHEQKFDVEIGIKEGDEIMFYGNKTREIISQEYPPLKYDILLVDSTYAELHNKTENHIYAISTHPNLTQDDFDNKITIPGVPMLLEFNQGKVINYYFDDKEIIDHIQSDTKSLNEYWNLGENN